MYDSYLTKILNVGNYLYSLQHSLFMMMFNVPMNLSCRFSDGTTGRWIQRQNVRSDGLSLFYTSSLDLTANMWLGRFNLNAREYEPSYCWLYCPGLIMHCLNPHCINWSWQHWLCLHAWRCLLSMRLLWCLCVCVLIQGNLGEPVLHSRGADARHLRFMPFGAGS